MPAPRDPTPLVFLPGLLCDDALWAHQVEALSDLAAPAVADLTRDDSIQAMAARVLAGAPPRFALAGLSMGGYVALAMARAEPDRITRLALLDTNAHADAPEQSERRRALIALAESGHFEDVPPALIPALLSAPHQRDPALTGLVADMAHRVGPRAFARQQTAIMGRPDARPTLAAIACPALVLCGADDALTPPAIHREMHDALPDARLIVVPDSGHLSPIEQPAAVSAALRDWLTGA